MLLRFAFHGLPACLAMTLRTCMASTLAVLFVASLSNLGTARSLPRSDDLRALDGEWVYVEDRTEGRAPEQQGPPMSAKFSFRIEPDAVILVSGHGSGHRDVRVALDGSVTEIAGDRTISRYRGAWKNGAFAYQTEFARTPGTGSNTLIRKEFRTTKEGVVVRVEMGSSASVGLYRHPQDIALPTPAKATIGDLAWLGGAWVGTRGAEGATSIEERWGPPLGGAMLAVSRTVTRGKMSAFEFLRIVERDSALIYIAQPGGAAPTEFVLTELGAKRAVFENPRHDYPKRIVYELSSEGGLTASIGFTKGGTPLRFEFKREGR
jgi:hypothetical protein